MIEQQYCDEKKNTNFYQPYKVKMYTNNNTNNIYSRIYIK